MQERRDDRPNSLPSPISEAGVSAAAGRLSVSVFPERGGLPAKMPLLARLLARLAVARAVTHQTHADVSLAVLCWSCPRGVMNRGKPHELCSHHPELAHDRLAMRVDGVD